jgi:hypothetical protein
LAPALVEALKAAWGVDSGEGMEAASVLGWALEKEAEPGQASGEESALGRVEASEVALASRSCSFPAWHETSKLYLRKQHYPPSNVEQLHFDAGIQRFELLRY